MHQPNPFNVHTHKSHNTIGMATIGRDGGDKMLSWWDNGG